MSFLFLLRVAAPDTEEFDTWKHCCSSRARTALDKLNQSVCIRLLAFEAHVGTTSLRPYLEIRPLPLPFKSFRTGGPNGLRDESNVASMVVSR